MKKTLLLLSLAAFAASGIEARTLSPAEALSRAVGAPAAQASRSGQPAVSAVPVMTVGEAGSPAAYVFNQDNDGFLIISADDVAAPLLGYSDSGSFDPDNIPDNLRWWLGEYAAQIEAANAAGSAAYSSINISRLPVAPLLSTKWDQGAPYYNLCPKLGGQQTVTGCVATAMAQVMKFHNWPDKAASDAKFAYEWRMNVDLSADYSNYAFDWDNMLDSYSGSYSDAQSAAVAGLMKACGYSVEMNYGTANTGGSGAASEKIGGALISAFKYSQDLENAPRVLYSTSGWEDLIYAELEAGRPVIYAGSGTGGGHCFVCDGYEGKGYFHFNWGWSGSGDGYFLLNALDPDELGIGGGTGGFNSGQMALIGVKPAKTGSSILPMKFACDGLLSAVMQGTKLIIYGNFTNFGTRTAVGTINFEIYNQAGVKVKVYQSTVSENSGYEPGAYWPEFVLSNISLPDDGTYRLYVTFTMDGKTYPYLCSPSQAGYVMLTQSGGTITVSVPGVDKYSAVNVNLETGLYAGSEFYVTGAAHYEGAAESSLPICGVLMSGKTEADIIGVGDMMPQVFSPDADVNFEYLSSWFVSPVNGGSLNVSTPGGYYFAMAMECAGGYMLLSEPVRVIVNSKVTSPAVSVDRIVVENQDAVDPDNVVVKVNLKCTSGVFYDYLMVALFTDSWQNIGQYYTDTSIVSAGQTKTFTANFSIDDAQPGARYYVMPYYWNDSWTPVGGSEVFTVGRQSGIADVITDGAAIITASPNPADDHTVISAASDIVRVDIASVSGLITDVPVEIDGTTARVDVSKLTTGLYVARVVTSDGVEVVKIVKK